MECAEELGTYGKDTRTGGRQPTGLGCVLQGGGVGGSYIWVGYVADDSPHGKGPGKFPAQGRQEYYGEAAEATGVWEMGVPTAGDSDG